MCKMHACIMQNVSDKLKSKYKLVSASTRSLLQLVILIVHIFCVSALFGFDF